MSVKLRKKKISKGRYSLYLDIYQNGKRNYEFLKLYLTNDKEYNNEIISLAENIRAKRQIEISSSEHGFIPSFKKKANFIEYFESLIPKKVVPKNWKSVFIHLKEFTHGHVRISSIDNKWLESLQKYLLKKVSPHTAHTYYSIVKAALNQAVIDKIIINNPCMYVSNLKKPEVERIYLTIDEIGKIVNTEFRYNEIKRSFLFACFTGLRFSDLRKLTWSQIQEDGNRYKIAIIQTKTGGVEYLPLSKSAINIIENGSENIIQFPSKKVFRIWNNAWVNKQLKELAKQAGINKILTTHVARHTFATLSLTKNVDIYTVSKLLGHKNLSHTQIYAKIIDERLNEAVDSLPEIEVK